MFGFVGPTAGGSGGGSIATASDVTLTSVAADDILKYNGSGWVNTDVVSKYCVLTRDNSTQSGFGSSAWVPVQWNAETSDGPGWHDNASNPARVTCGAGLYLVQFTGYLNASAWWGRVTDGTSCISSPTSPAHTPAINSALATIQFIVPLAGAYLQVELFTSTSSRTLSGADGSNNPQLIVAKLA